MLRRLSLRDFVIVPTLELDFGPGFTALTGETGAGKSILIDALQLVLGQRADAGVVREGQARAELAAEFDTPASLAPWLAEAGFDEGLAPEEQAGRPLLLRRSVDAQGKSRAWINGSAATLSQLRELGEQLVDIHGQHAWQGLTRPEPVRALLDAHAGLAPANLAAAHAAWRAARTRLHAAQDHQAAQGAEQERLRWELAELERLAPREGEWAELEAEQRRLSHAQAIVEALQAALDRLAEGEPAAGPLLAQALDRLEGVWPHDDSLGGLIESLRGAQAVLEEARRELRHRLRDDGLDPARLAELDARLGAWLGLARRLREPPEALPARLQQARADAARLAADADLPALEAATDRAWQAYEAEALRTRAARAAAAPRLAAAVAAALPGLGMAGARFEVALSPSETPAAHGLDTVEFLFAGHPGATPRPLVRVASGGELSRLALAVALAGGGESAGPGPDCLIFDEVDAGVGGAVADAVGLQLQALGRRHQVFAVTHLPQVAACADHQWQVSKQVQDGRSASRVTACSGPARVEELARMLGGEAGPTRLAHARALLQARGHTAG